MKTKLLFLGVILTVLAVLVTFFAPSTVPISPLDLNTPTPIHGLSDSREYVILGFAPYWNLKKLSPESLESITHFAYFNLHLNSDGSLYKLHNAREEDPAYTNYKRLVSGSVNRGTKPLILTFMPESQEALSLSISSPTRRAATIDTIVSTMAESESMGVNIDYEPLGDVEESTRNNFTLFIKELRERLNGFTDSRSLSISTYASAASRPRLWDLAALAPHTDYFVIMTYDYTMPSSLVSGPNSPLRGSGDSFEHDIIKNIAEISALVPSRQILLGIPFYGYEWDTLDATKYSPTTDRGSVASLERIEQMLAERTLELVWDRNSLTPYGVASESGQISQIYFENTASLKLKLDFVKSASLGGVAIWALGYEGSNSWVWGVMDTLNR